MVRNHRRFLYTRPMRIIAITIVICYLIYLFIISQYQDTRSQVLFHQEQLQYEYILQAFIPLKLLIVFLISFGWIYATRWNQYDVFLWSHSSVIWVSLSRYIVLVEWSGLIALGCSLLYMGVYMLYPYDVAITTWLQLIGSMVVFVVYYNSLCFLFERMITHLFGLLIPLLLFLMMMIQSDVNIHSNRLDTSFDWIQLFAPDIGITTDGFGFLFGVVMVMSLALFEVIIGLWFVQKQDAI